jgi:membrane protein implicated in regulation of membrane protease activity
MIIYAACLALGLCFTIISAIAGHLFGSHDGGDFSAGGHAEAGLDTHGMPGISFFSPTILATLVTAFGAFGILFTKIQATENIWVSAPLSAASGGVVAWVVFLLFNFMFKRIQSSSESQVASLPGQEASVITPIPQNGVGEIAYVQGGTRYNAPARTEDGAPVAAGKPVRIRRVIGTQFYVEPIN